MIALLLAVVPFDGVIEDAVDRIELSHIYTDHGEYSFTQLIFYDWNREASQWDIVAWRMVGKQVRPQKQWSGGGYEVLWQDRDILRRVHAGSFAERWDQHDPELAARRLLPPERRRELTSPRRDEP